MKKSQQFRATVLMWFWVIGILPTYVFNPPPHMKTTDWFIAGMGLVCLFFVARDVGLWLVRLSKNYSLK